MFPRICGVGDAALFYTDREAIALSTAKLLKLFFDSDETVYCLMSPEDLDSDDVEKVKGLRDMIHIVAEDGNRLITSNRAPCSHTE